MALAYVAAHIPSLAPSPEDIDSLNFVLGLRQFDPALHQPHPPGYPVYIALGHVSLWLINAAAPALDQLRNETWALAIWSALFGGVAIVGAVRLFSAAERWSGTTVGPFTPTAVWATALMAACPLFWVSGLRPMSDMPGLALVLWAQALALEARHDRTRLIIAALIAGIAGGIRVQTLALTVPILLLAAIELRFWSARASIGWLVTRPIAACAAGLAAWAVPLLILTGGVDGYLRALGSQAAEDFAWVDMLWADPTPRRIAFALYDTLVLPWGVLPLAVAVCVLAAVGAVAALRRVPAALGILLLGFVPYTIFHLLFQEVISVRYALPVVPLVAWAAVNAVAIIGRRSMTIAAAAITTAALIVAVPDGIAYGREAHPAFRAIADAERQSAAESVAASFAHWGLRRALQTTNSEAIRFQEPMRQYEWMGAVDYWREGGTGPILFFADPMRTDLALFDPQSLGAVTRYRWAVDGRMEMSGTRPRGVDLYRIAPPGWFAGTGWSLTPEAGGITRASASGPDARPIEAWVRRRATPVRLVVGGRHLGDPGAPAAEISLAIDDRIIDRWNLTVDERNFIRFIDLPEGVPAGHGMYARLTIRSRSTEGEGARAEVAIRQFDAQGADRIVYGFGEGWHEDEYAPATGLRWRWTSERSVLRVLGPTQPVRLLVRGESPLKYFDAPPLLTVSAGDRRIGELRPAADFEWSVVVPGDAWTASGGEISLAVDRVYLPGPAEGTDDARHLGVRLFEIRVDPVSP